MNIKTLPSDKARDHWRDMIDIALTGGRVIIERYKKPQAVLIGYTQLNALLQQIQELEAWQDAQRINQGIVNGQAQAITLEQHKARMQAKGATYAVGNRV